MERRPFSIDHALLIALAAISLSALALALHTPALFLVTPLMIASGFCRVVRLPRRAAQAIHGTGLLIAAAVALVPVLATFQTITIDQATRFAAPAGAALSFVTACFLFMVPGWSAASTILPASIALLGAAGLRRDTPSLVFLYPIAAACIAIYLAAGKRPRLLPLLSFGVVTAVVTLSICRLLPWAQPWVEAKAGDLLAPGPTARAGLSLTSRLGEVEELALSREIAMRVWTSTPQYLRARVYTRFNGQAWAMGPAESRSPLASGGAPDGDTARWLEETPGSTVAVPGANAGPPLIRSRILQENSRLKVIPAPGQVVFARLDEARGWIDDAGVLIPADGAPALYAVVNRRDRDVVQSDRTPTPDCLDTQKAVDRRLRELAARLRSGADPAERVRRTVDYLGTTCTYSLKVGAFKSADPVAEFVFDKRRGYCEYFASAAALLLRLQDVPARYVVGYAVGPSNREGGHYVVRQADAHAWVEAYLPDRGWVEVDPTPAAQFEAMRAPSRAGALAGEWERIKAWVAERVATIRQGGVLAFLGRSWTLLLGAAIAVALAFGWRRIPWRNLFSRRPKASVRPDPDGVPAELLALLRSLDRAWSRSGHPRPPGRAPLEHLRSLPAAARVGDAVVDAFYRCRYGGQVLSESELAGLQRGLTEPVGRGSGSNPP
jgi:hypothetical protein